MKLSVVGTLLALLLAACSPQPYIPTPTKTPDGTRLAASSATPLPTPTISPTATSIPPTATPTLTSVPAPTSLETAELTPILERTEAPPPETNADLLENDHYWLQRPISNDYRDYLDRTYAYGATGGGRYRPHTGVEFFNPSGTPVLAAADGIVHLVGTDDTTMIGPQLNFYGNLIILQHNGRVYEGQTVYTLYGHLSEIGVEQGQGVSAGEVIGEVGGTGVANGGAHLHFEVRLGDPLNYQASTRNPDLWISPYYGYGTLAGRIVNAEGMLLPEVAITIQGEDTTRYTWTYAGSENHPDDQFGENFTYGDLPEGWYTVTTSSGTKTYRREVYIEAGRTTWLEFNFGE